MKFLKIIYSEFILYSFCFIKSWPGRLGLLFRSHIYSQLYKKCRIPLYIYPSVDIKGFHNISIGHNCIINHNSHLYSHRGTLKIGNNFALGYNSSIISADGGSILIGDDIIIAQNVVLRSSNHCFTHLSIPIRYQGHDPGFIVIEDDVWIGANSVILPNVKIGADSIIGAGSVVTKDIPSHSIYGGVPAKLIKLR